MALVNTNVHNTKLGLDLNSSYIRLEIFIKPDGSVEVAYNFYKDEASYDAGDDVINSSIDFDLSNYVSGVVSPVQLNIQSIHQLAKDELVARGLDVAKLAIVDIA
jgi:hypothetical protein